MNSYDNKMDSDRNNSYDLLRIISTVAVVFIHVNWYYFSPVYSESKLNSQWIIMSLINIISRFSVPVFVMLSGAFNLSNSKNVDFKYFYYKSLKKIFFPFLIVLLIYSMFQVVSNVLNNNHFYEGMLETVRGGFFNLWYIYMLAGLYFLTPYIVNLKSKISYRSYKILSVVLMLWALISQATSKYLVAYSIGVVFSFLSYYLLGDIINIEIRKYWKPSLFRIIIVIIICILISYIFRYFGVDYYIQNGYVCFFSPPIALYSILIFSLFSSFNFRTNFYYISRLTYYIYLFHTLFFIISYHLVNYFPISVLIKEIIVVVITLVLSFIALLLFDYCIKKCYRIKT